ncbi:chemotaxis protein CheR [Sagittula sp. NFXS13]|uniref:chemotaxis protein CheB n=1 Tax=Sagittula sp. NFXS13 TaxID=2819095 RepID=UPI0032DEB55F
MGETNTVQTVVGIAASAGGLEAMSLMAHHLPTDLNCAYVLAQHMSSHHASMLQTLLSRETRLKVLTVEDKTPLEANAIYVPVPGSDLEVRDGMVHRCEPAGRPAEPKPSADRLFRSVAESFGEHSVGVVLSGTGSDGTYGVQAIQEVGGITIAQDASSAKYDTMPSSAVQSGFIDLVLSPRQIGEHLRQILARPRDFADLQVMIEQPTEYDDLFQMLQSHTKVDFRQYKETTVSRRIKRRMFVKGFDGYGDYVAFCKENTGELDALYRDLLISVTRFFRDPDQYEVLREELARYVAATDHRPIRVWVPGCASGEEPYSIAFILCDLLGIPASEAGRAIQIFATDLDTAALARGRAGLYPAAASTSIPEHLREKFTTQRDSQLRINPEVRKLVLFSQHDVIQDPPFSDIDLVSFRNALIYFESALQVKVMSRILYALRPDGLLFLGTSENVGKLDAYFTAVTDQAKLFRKTASKSFDRTSLVRFGIPQRRQRESSEARGPENESGVNGAMFETLAMSVAPTGFLVCEQKDLVRIFGDISAFTRVTDAVRGRLTTNTLKAELAQDAASLIPLCLKQKSARKGLWRVMEGAGFNRVRLRGYPIQTPTENDMRYVLVSIETQLVQHDARSPSEKDSNGQGAVYLAHVENELADAREALQITMEELQASNVELQSTNEEVQSANEELQSTNEELETTNEELQSTNEELITVNEELLINTDELNRLVVVQTAILESMLVPLLALDSRLNIKHASQPAIALFELTAHGADMGHISQASLPSPGFPNIVKLCSEVLAKRTIQTVDYEVDGAVHTLSAAPYFIRDTELTGLVVTIEGMN